MSLIKSKRKYGMQCSKYTPQNSLQAESQLKAEKEMWKLFLTVLFNETSKPLAPPPPNPSDACYYTPLPLKKRGSV